MFIYFYYTISIDEGHLRYAQEKNALLAGAFVNLFMVNWGVVCVLYNGLGGNFA